MADPLATLAELEAHLQRPVDPASGNLALGNASGAVRAWCGWIISREAYTFICDGSGRDLLSLPTLHLHDVIEVRLFGEPLDAADTYEGYCWSAAGQLIRLAGWPADLRSIEIDVVHGYDPVPDAVRAVTLNLAGRQIANPQALRSATVGTVTRAYSTEQHAQGGGLTTLDAAMLDRFRIPMSP